MMEQALLFKKHLVDIIDPNITLFGEHHLKQLNLTLDLVKQIKSPIEITTLDSIIKPQPIKNALVSVDMFFEEEKQILVEMMLITLGHHLTQWTQSALGNLLTQLEQMRREFLPAESEYEMWSLHSLVKYSVYKRIYNQTKTEKQPVYEDFDNHCLNQLEKIFGGFNGTAMAHQLCMDDYLQFDLDKKFSHEPFEDIKTILKKCFKNYFFGPALVFFNYLNARVLENQMSLLPYMASVVDSKHYEPDLAPWEGLKEVCETVLQLSPWDIPCQKTFDLIKRVDRETNLDSFKAVVKLMEQRFLQMKLPQGQANIIQLLLVKLKDTTESTVRFVVAELQKTAQKVQNGGERIRGAEDVFQVQVVKIEDAKDPKTISRQQLQKMTKEEIIDMFVDLQKMK
uniref:Uncharacterized protein n=1 Tax=Trepomonas sp. PC1 TaxID=1076344 RepID=A0A146K3R6_9EUKA|eukprot:JAP90159.1 Hypothetical protein TPC1_30346 [Trepomonas sp. PC1]